MVLCYLILYYDVEYYIEIYCNNSDSIILHRPKRLLSTGTMHLLQVQPGRGGRHEACNTKLSHNTLVHMIVYEIVFIIHMTLQYGTLSYITLYMLNYIPLDINHKH